MSDTVETVTVVGAIDGPRAEILAELAKKGTKLSMGNVCEVFNLNPDDVFVPKGECVLETDEGLVRGKLDELADEQEPIAVEGDVDPMTRAGQLHIAIVDLLEADKIHSQKGRSGGLKLGAQPPKTAKSASASAFAKIRKNR